MAEGLASLDPDVLFLQEAFVCPALELYTAASLAEQLQMKLYSLTSREKIRTFSGESHQSTSNLALLSKYPLTNIQSLHIPFCNADPDRWILMGHVDWNGIPVKLVNTHFTHIKREEGQQARRAQAMSLVDASVPPESGLSLLGGDLNAGWESPELAPLRDLSDRLLPDRDTVVGTFHGRSLRLLPQGSILDYLLLRRGDSAPHVNLKRQFTALDEPRNDQGEFPSDHAAVVVDIELGPSG